MKIHFGSAALLVGGLLAMGCEPAGDPNAPAPPAGEGQIQHAPPAGEGFGETVVPQQNEAPGAAPDQGGSPEFQYDAPGEAPTGGVIAPAPTPEGGQP